MARVLCPRKTLITGGLFCTFMTMSIMPSHAVTVNIDTVDAIEVFILNKPCKSLTEAGKEGFIKAKSAEDVVFNANSSGDCEPGRGKTYLGRAKNTKGEDIDVPEGAWVVAGKILEKSAGVKGFIHNVLSVPVAVCKVNKGSSYALRTNKSETARGLLGKSLGLGLTCEEMSKAAPANKAAGK